MLLTQRSSQLWCILLRKKKQQNDHHINNPQIVMTIQPFNDSTLANYPVAQKVETEWLHKWGLSIGLWCTPVVTFTVPCCLQAATVRRLATWLTQADFGQQVQAALWGRWGAWGEEQLQHVVRKGEGDHCLASGADDKHGHPQAQEAAGGHRQGATVTGTMSQFEISMLVTSLTWQC